jgi:hypothetical protein
MTMPLYGYKFSAPFAQHRRPLRYSRHWPLKWKLRNRNRRCRPMTKVKPLY